MRRLVIAGLVGCAPVTATHAPRVPVQGAALLDSSGPPSEPAPPPVLADTPLPGPPTPLSPPGPADGQVGTAHQALVTAADPRGRWVTICQARADTDGNGYVGFRFGHHGNNEGDEASLYLVRGSGAGEVIEGLIARDDSGRWLVVARERDEISLLDVEAGTSVTLFPAMGSLREELYPLKDPSITFDPSGEYLLYRRRSAQHVVLVVRHLGSGHEQIVDPGPGTLLSARWEGSAWLRTRVVRDDVDGDGVIELPKDYGSGWDGTCGQGSTSFLGGASPDVRVEHIAWSTGLRRGEAYTSLADELLIEEAGAVAAVTPAGARRELAFSPGCRPIHGDAARGRVLADCDDSEATRLVVLDAAGQRELGRVPRTLSELRLLSPRLLELGYFDGPSQWLDLATLRRHDGTPGETADAVYEEHVLIRGERDVLVDVAAGRERLVLGRSYWAPARSGGRYVHAHPWLVDLERGKRLARIERTVHAVGSDGRLLVDVGEGVLRWRPWPALRRAAR